MGVGIQVLAYNREAFQRAGQTPPPGWAERAWNWDRYLLSARALTRDAEGPGAQWGSGNPWGDDRRIAYLYGGAWFDLKAYETGRATTFLHEPNAVAEGIQLAADLMHRHRVRPTPADATRVAGTVVPFLAGRVAMEAIATSNFARWSDAGAPAWGVAAVPTPQPCSGATGSPPIPGSASSWAATGTSSGPCSSSWPAGSRCASSPCSPPSSRPAPRWRASSRTTT